MLLRFRIHELAPQYDIKTAAELAREAKIGQATAYSLWNNDRHDANYSTLIAISRVLGVKPDDLVEAIDSLPS